MKNFDRNDLKCIIFDCDGVLVDSEIIASSVSVRLLKEYGFKMEPKEYAKVFAGKVEEDIMSTIREEYKISLPNDFTSKLRIEIDRGLDNELQPIEGVKTTISGINGLKAVVSNSRLTRVLHSLKVAGLSDLFEKKIFSVEMVEKPKPAPDIYLHAAKELKVIPSQCLVIEDSRSGVTAASSAGMNIIGFCGASHIPMGHDKALLEAGAFITVNDMEELSYLLKELMK